MCLQALIFWVSKGRMGEPALSSQDVKGCEKEEEDERQKAPGQRSENGPFPTCL